MTEPDFEDIHIHEILSKGRKEIPFPDFEDEIMVEIHKEHDRKRSILKNIKLSWFFFIIGMVSGITLISILPINNESTEDAFSNFTFLSGLLIAFCLIILLFAEKLLKYFLEHGYQITPLSEKLKYLDIGWGFPLGGGYIITLKIHLLADLQTLFSFNTYFLESL